MVLETNAFLLELNYVSEQRKQLCYGLPGPQIKYLLRCLDTPRQFLWDGVPEMGRLVSAATTNSLLPNF